MPCLLSLAKTFLTMSFSFRDFSRLGFALRASRRACFDRKGCFTVVDCTVLEVVDSVVGFLVAVSGNLFWVVKAVAGFSIKKKVRVCLISSV